ncbi:MAG: TonB-dependent siderophore receptor, partial [Solimonas sp.]
MRETPQSVTVITRDQMIDQDMRSIRDVLDNTTGVSSYAYDTERVVFTARGFIIDNTMYDGVPVAPGLNTSSTDANADTAVYERIEVIRGATGLLSGAGNPSAAVNFVRKRADSRSTEASVSVSGGSWNDWRVEGDLSTKLDEDGKVRGRVVGAYEESDSYTDLYHSRKRVLFGTVDADLSPTTLLTLGYDYQEKLPESPTWGSFPLFFKDESRTNWSRSVTTSTDWAYWNNKSQTAFATLQQKLGGDWALRGTATHRTVDSDSLLFYMEGFPDKQTGEGLQGYTFYGKEHAQQNSLDLFLNGSFELFGHDHQLVVGYNGSKLSDDAYEYAPIGDLPDIGNFYQWTGDYPRPTFSRARTTDIDQRIDQNSLYAALRYVIFDPLKLIAGARYTDWKSEGVNWGVDAGDKHEEVTPYAGLLLDVGRHHTLFASYTEIFTPQFDKGINNRPLDPKEGNSKEAGIKGEYFGGRFNTALTLFDTRQDNVGVLIEDPLVPDLPDGSRPSRAVDGTRTRGFEAEATGQPLKNWNIQFGWSHYTMQDGDGQTIKGYLPRTLVRVFTTWKPNGPQGLSVGGGVNWRSSTYLNVAKNADGDMARVDQG